jgi:hypothetical protein
MRRTLTFVSILFICALSIGITAAAKLNFTGTWVLDRSRSIGMPAEMKQTMTVVHTEDDKLQVETKIVTPQGERVVKDTFSLDGKEAEFTPQGPPGAPPAKGKRTGGWLPRGNGIVVNEETVAETPNGAVKSQLTRKWTLAPDGKTLTIDMYIDGPQGSFETKRIFVKQ